MMLLFILKTFCLLFFFSLIPQTAWAWGPGTHLSYALHALENLSHIGPSIAHLLEKFPQVYLYGTIAADIIFGKKFAGELYHCHHWDVALPLLQEAKSPRQRTFIYGYLSHLAVDTVAHNYYVPYKIIASFEARTLRHTYWEMRFDQRIAPQAWDTLQEISKSDFSDLDEYLSQKLKKTLFTFKTNKKIFNSLLLVQRMKKWRQASELLTRRRNHRLANQEVQHFKELCHEVLIEFLKKPKSARVLRADPSGNLKLLYAKEMVRDLRKYVKRGLVSHSRAHRLIHEIKERLHNSLYEAADLPLITDALH